MDVKQILNGGPVARWYKIPGSDVRVSIVTLKPSRHDELQEAATKPIFNGGKMERLADNNVLMDSMLNEMVQDWENISEDGKPFPCTKENKKALDENWAPFRKLWHSVFLETSAIETAIQETEIKN